MLTLFGAWVLGSALFAAFLGKCMAVGAGEPPEHVSPADWTRITERHVPHVIPFKRRAQ